MTTQHDSPLLPFVDGRTDVARFSLTPVEPQLELPEIDGLLAGAAQVDITPPPGMPKAGFSRNAHDGTGFRTRLKARVLHLRAGRSSLAIVQGDLFGGSSLVQHLVAAAIADRTDVRLPGVFIGATHTHAGPGQYDASAFYNHWASNRPGFDPAWTQELVDRLAGAVIEAVDSRRPARLAIGRTEVWGLTRNRSLAPYVRNRTVADKRLEPQRKFASINPWLHLLRVDARAGDGAFEPLAAAVIFSIHGTGISHHCPEYHADVWGYLTGELSDRIEQATGRRPVVGAVEGTHADCAPATREGRAGFLEAERVGRGIGAEAAALYSRLEPELSDRVELTAGVRELDLAHGANAIDGIRLPVPMLGASQLAGAKEHTTPLLDLIPPFRAGYPQPFGRHRPHGRKWVIGSRWLQPRFLPTDDFPRVITLQVLRINDTAIVGAPFEITVEAGRRITEAVQATGIGTAIVSSLANGYCGYCTTAEEYGLQYYEGGHNLHGPATQAWIAAQAARLARDVAARAGGPVADPLPQRRFALPVHRYLPRSGQSAAPYRRILAPAEYHDPVGEDHGWWEVVWSDAAPADLRWQDPMVRVEVHDRTLGWTTAVDDQGLTLGVTHRGPAPSGEGHAYAARWFAPWLGAGRRHRFVVLAHATQPDLVSEGFD